MANNNSGFWGLFFRENKKSNSPSTDVANNKTANNFSANTSVNNSLVEDFTTKLHEYINQNNQSGFDFMEFTDALFEESNNPDQTVYKTVFRIAQKMDKNLDVQKLLASASFYKNLVQTTADQEISKGEQKKLSLENDKKDEQNKMSNIANELKNKIAELRIQLQQLENEQAENQQNLSNIDLNYRDKFADIDEKVNAIRLSKEKVIASIVDIESGIRKYLS